MARRGQKTKNERTWKKREISKDSTLNCYMLHTYSHMCHSYYALSWIIHILLSRLLLKIGQSIVITLNLILTAIDGNRGNAIMQFLSFMWGNLTYSFLSLSLYLPPNPLVYTLPQPPCQSEQPGVKCVCVMCVCSECSRAWGEGGVCRLSWHAASLSVSHYHSVCIRVCESVTVGLPTWRASPRQRQTWFQMQCLIFL